MDGRSAGREGATKVAQATTGPPPVLQRPNWCRANRTRGHRHDAGRNSVRTARQRELALSLHRPRRARGQRRLRRGGQPSRLPGRRHLRLAGVRHPAGVTGRRPGARGAHGGPLRPGDRQPRPPGRPLREHPRRRRRALLPGPSGHRGRRPLPGPADRRRGRRSAPWAARAGPAPATSTSASRRRARARSGRSGGASSGRSPTSMPGGGAARARRRPRSTRGRARTRAPARPPCATPTRRTPDRPPAGGRPAAARAVRWSVARRRRPRARPS